MDKSLLIVLRAHNPWLGQPRRQAALLQAQLPRAFVPRRQQLEFRAGRAELIVGPRQAGKSTLIRWQLGRQRSPCLLLHAEEPRIRELCQSPAAVLHALQEVLQENTILFLEEIQHLREAPLFIKGLVDLAPGRRIVATGSSSFQFEARTRESLAGRARRQLVLPFALAEVAAAEPRQAVRALRETRLAELWERLVVGGGFPRPWFERAPEVDLHRLVESFVLKDASDLHTVDRPGAFRKLLELAAADVGNLVNVSNWAALAQLSRNTAVRYLDIAQQAHVLRLVEPFVGGKRAEITGAPKVYFVDNGLRNALFGGFGASAGRADRGALWENAVYAELLKQTDLLDRVSYWRSKNRGEVDFVVERQGRLFAVEVKAQRLLRPAMSRSARSFIEAYRPTRFVVVNEALRQDLEVASTAVLFRRPWEIADAIDVE